MQGQKQFWDLFILAQVLEGQSQLCQFLLGRRDARPHVIVTLVVRSGLVALALSIGIEVRLDRGLDERMEELVRRAVVIRKNEAGERGNLNLTDQGYRRVYGYRWLRNDNKSCAVGGCGEFGEDCVGESLGACWSVRQ
jgi:hypothetical protein